MPTKRRPRHKPSESKSARARLTDLLRALGAKGGKTRAKNMTAAERSDAARKAIRARWANRKKS